MLDQRQGDENIISNLKFNKNKKANCYLEKKWSKHSIDQWESLNLCIVAGKFLQTNWRGRFSNIDKKKRKQTFSGSLNFCSGQGFIQGVSELDWETLRVWHDNDSRHEDRLC